MLSRDMCLIGHRAKREREMGGAHEQDETASAKITKQSQSPRYAACTHRLVQYAGLQGRT
jgi:hypothetical protein